MCLIVKYKEKIIKSKLLLNINVIICILVVIVVYKLSCIDYNFFYFGKSLRYIFVFFFDL